MTEGTEAKVTPPVDQLKLAIERTYLAYERTTMAWVRTGTSLITFGFALYKFYYFVHQNRHLAQPEEWVDARAYGLCMMGFGVGTLLLAALQRRQSMKMFRQWYPDAPMSLSYVLAVLMGAFGLLAFVIALFRLI